VAEVSKADKKKETNVVLWSPFIHIKIKLIPIENK